jgi:tRNA (cmo5U34)-methyltransferase
MSQEANRKQVDDTISMVEGSWEFNGEVAEHFDSHARKSIPLYEEFQDMTTAMSEWFIHNGSRVYDLGSSTGVTIFNLNKKHATKKNVRFIGIDNSDAMIKEARKNNVAKNIKFSCQELANTSFLKADLVISLFTLQFINLPERIKVMDAVYRCLNAGGALIMAEKVLAEEGRFDQLWMDLYWDFKKKQGLTDDQILHKARSIRGVLKPLTLFENIKLLRIIGFDSIDVFLKWYNFAGICAIKTASSPFPSAEYKTKAHDSNGNKLENEFNFRDEKKSE